MQKRMMLTLIIVFAFMGSARAEVYRLVTLEYQPYVYQDEGGIKGFAYAIVQEGFKRMGDEIIVLVRPWARSLKMVRDGEAHAIFPAMKTPEREVFLNYSELFVSQTISLFVRKDSPIKFDGDLSKLSGHVFGVIREYSYSSVFDTARDERKIHKFDTAGNLTQNLRKLVAGRFDVLVSNRYGALFEAKKMDITDNIKELEPYVQTTPSYIAFSKKLNTEKLCDRFNKILAEMKKDGTYDRIIDSYVSE